MAESIRPGGSHKTTNDVVFGLLRELINRESVILDFGAGAGHMCQRVGEHLSGKGMDPKEHLVACEVVPEKLQYAGVECRRIATDSKIPFDEGSFDIIYAIEVLEHAPRPYDFFEEAFDKLKEGGRLIFTVPNTLHMMSRLRFFFTGFGDMYPAPSVETENAGRICGHIMPLNYAYFNYGLRKAGFRTIDFHVDRKKRSATALAVLFYPLLKWSSRRLEKSLRDYDVDLWKETREVVLKMNSMEMLTSRSCILSAQK